MSIGQEVYKAMKEKLALQLHVPMEKVTSLIRRPRDGVYKEYFKEFNDYSLVDLYDFVWFYLRAQHFSVDTRHATIPKEVDMTLLQNIDDDFIIEINDKYVVWLGKRIFPFNVRSVECNWSCIVYAADLSNMAFSFNDKKSWGKVFMHDNALCGKCGRCKHFEGCECYNRVGKIGNDCPLSQALYDPMAILQTILVVVASYMDAPERVHGSKGKMHGSVVKANHDTGADTIKITYKKESENSYHPSQRVPYKGGTHKSPVAHARRGYWRKTSKGTHDLIDGEFVAVESGKGHYRFVDGVIINPQKDCTTKSEITIE